MIEIFTNAKIGERMRKSGITVSKGSLDYVLHNLRVKDTANSIFDKSDNIYMNDYETALEIYRTELAKRIEAYTKRTGKKLQKHTITHLSAIVNLDAHNCDTEHMRKLVEYLERKFGTKVFNWAIHKDEGWIDETGEKHVNYHAHIEMLGIDENGNSIRRKLDKKTLRKLQTEVARILDMPRGVYYNETTRRKRLSTYQYKEHARLKAKLAKENEKLKQENERLKQELAKVKDLKELNRRLREELKEAGALRAQYAQLEAYIKELKEQVKTKELTIKELEEKLKEKKEKLLAQIKSGREKEERINELERVLLEQKRKNEKLEQLLKQKDEEIERLEREEMERDWSERETATRKKKRKTRGFKM